MAMRPYTTGGVRSTLTVTVWLAVPPSPSMAVHGCVVTPSVVICSVAAHPKVPSVAIHVSVTGVCCHEPQGPGVQVCVMPIAARSRRWRAAPPPRAQR